MAAVISPWHVRHARSVTAAFRAVMRSESGYRPVVKARECQKPFCAFVRYFGTSPEGV